MNKTQLLALAAFITSLANTAGGETAAPAATEAPTGDKPQRGRPPKDKHLAADEPEPEPAKACLTIEDLKEAVKPLMADKRDAEVRAAIKKHGDSLSDVVAKGKAEALLADIEALKL